MRRGQFAAYASGSFATGAFATVPTVLLLYFCTETLRISPASAALIVFAPKIWAILWDPFVGAWSDRTTGKHGRRRPFLIAGAAGVSLFFVALFAPPALPAEWTIAWVGLAYFGLATFYSLFAVPYIALPAEIAERDADRARLISWRMILVMIGVLAGASIAPLLIAAFGGGRQGYAGMAVVIALACALAMCGPVLMLRPFDSGGGRPGPHVPLLRQIGGALARPDFRALVCAFLLQLTAVGIVTSATPYLITGSLGRGEADIGVAFGAMLLATIAAVPAWSALGRRVVERPALAAAAVSYAVAATSLGLLAGLPISWPVALALLALVGIAFAGLQVLPFTLVAHFAHAEARRSGLSEEGAFTGVWTATEKLGLALGPAFTGLSIALLGRGGGAIPALIATAPAVLALISVAILVQRASAAEPVGR